MQSFSTESSGSPPSPSKFTREWLAGERVLCYRFHDLDRTTIDACVADLRRVLANWPAGQFWRLILDMRHQRAVISAYALRRARDLVKMRPELPGKMVILTSNRLATQIASMALRGLASDRRQRLVFTCEADAVAWLLRDDTISPPEV